MANKMWMLAGYSVLSIATLAWFPATDKDDTEIKMNSPAVSAAEVHSSNAASSNEKKVTASVSSAMPSSSGKNEFSKITQEQLNAMSQEEYVAFSERVLEALPANIQAEVYRQRAIAADHWKSIGVFTDEEKQGYSGYDKETLKTLGNQGDLLALDILADKYLREDRNLAKAKATFHRAVVFGSAKAAQSLAIFAGSKSLGAEDRLNMIDAIVWYQISGKLGHKLAESSRDSLLRRRGVTLTAKEWRLVQLKTKFRYEWFNKKRRELGLPEYSN